MSTFQTLLALAVLIYALCIIVQAVQEVLKSLLGTKAKTMEGVIRKFMGEKLLTPEQVETALKRLGFENLTALENFNEDDFRQLMEAIPMTADDLPEIRKVLGKADATIDQFKEHAEAAYDAAMAKFQRLYAANNKKLVIGLSFAIVLLLNASVIKIYGVLIADQAMSQRIAATGSTVGQPNPGGGASQTFDPDAITQEVTKELQAYPILLRTGEYPTDVKDPVNEFGGLIIMGILVSLGAPFWNDLLKGMTGVNNALNSGGKKGS